MISPVHDPQTRQTIVRLLSSMGSAKEISQYLKRFSQLDAARFAVVKVGGAVLRDDLQALTSSLAFLQDVGLTPIVIHGAGPQLDAELAAAGIEKRTVDGLRVTTPQALAVVRRVFHAQNLKLVEALQAQDARQRPHGQGLRQPRHPLEQRVAVADDGEEEQVDGLGLPDDDLGELAARLTRDLCECAGHHDDLWRCRCRSSSPQSPAACTRCWGRRSERCSRSC